MSLQIECLAPVIPQSGHNTSTSTSSLSCLLSLGASPSSPFPLFEAGCLPPHLFPLVSRWLFYTRRQRSPLFSLSLFVCMELLFIFMLLSVYWFLSVFECHYTCSHQGYRSWDAFCFITFLNWFHSAQAYAFSRLIALLDSCKETLLRHVKMYNCALCGLCAF